KAIAPSFAPRVPVMTAQPAGGRRTAPADFRTKAPALIVILLLAAALRLYGIGGVPTELDADEIDLYNSAYSIATTGHDIDGSLLPYYYSETTRNPPIYAI